jgi:hypothetical protein
MHMTFEKIEKEEHPAYRAAKMITELHEENIAKIDGGFIFMRDGINVNEDIRRESTAQIHICEQIMARAECMDPKHRPAAGLILDEFERIAAEANKNENGLATIPEIGNYDHGK